MDIPQQETEMDMINLLYLSSDNNGNYLFYHLRRGVVHTNQKQSVRLRSISSTVASSTTTVV